MEIFLKQIQGISFAAKGDSNHWVVIDGNKRYGGSEAGTSPMELMLIGLASCTGADVVSILSKRRVKLQDFAMRVRADRAEEHPKVFTKIHIEYYFYGEVKQNDVEMAIDLSQQKYCSAVAMLKKTAEVTHSYYINQQIE
ncbi:osmotically inducible protein OsmC [candidate division KSB1 bacterium]|nr:MAG: osmotically inducible protein OsmC [candidate division KSB1 bacterium 4484_219]RKY77479.1 MAG: osmotically inducible protein OsmC [candidate division KSB1 bacterium]HDI51341.1 OsmC family peroxiredoxin [Bacteroidota bacterium]RKY79097.1 MAG: osmotically inducible protein OsmC [candidate division KSB1 bacterium]RKY82955.1 MAG: osmotically inducible protein OsmC [candidate division KSB1 bacterium]